MKMKITGMLLLTLALCQACKKESDDDDKEPCGTITCLNGGTCQIQGSLRYCDCPDYYEGFDCGTEWSDKYIGSYTATPPCEAPASLTITKKSNHEFYVDAGNGKAEFAVLDYDSKHASMKSGQVLHYTYNGEAFHVSGSSIYYQTSSNSLFLSLAPINSATGQPVVITGGVCDIMYTK